MFLFSAIFRRTMTYLRILPTSITKCAPPLDTSITENVVLGQVGQQSLAKACGQKHLDHLRAEFEAFIAANGAEDGLKHLSDFVVNKRLAEEKAEQYVFQFLQQKRKNARELLGEQQSILHSPESLLEMASLHFLVDDFTNCAELLWGAATLSLERFAERLYAESPRTWEYPKRKKHVQMCELASFLHKGDRLVADGSCTLKHTWTNAQVCHNNYYHNNMIASDMEYALGVVPKFVSTLEVLQLDEATKEQVVKWLNRVSDKQKNQADAQLEAAQEAKHEKKPTEKGEKQGQ